MMYLKELFCILINSVTYKKLEHRVKDISVDNWLPARMKQAAAKQALSVVKSQRKKKKKQKPAFNRPVMELDSRFADIAGGVNSFDIWIKLSSVGNKIKLNLPAAGRLSQKRIHFNNFLKNG